MYLKLISRSHSIWVWYILHRAREVKSIIPLVDPIDDLMNSILCLVGLRIFCGKLIPLSFIKDWFNSTISIYLDKTLLNESLKSMHCIVCHGIMVFLAGIFSFQLIISCQLGFNLLFVHFFHLLLGLDFLLGSSSFRANLKII